VCRYALKVLGIDPAAILPEVDQVGNGFISVVGYHAQGYSAVTKKVEGRLYAWRPFTISHVGEYNPELFLDGPFRGWRRCNAQIVTPLILIKRNPAVNAGPRSDGGVRIAK
jgi:hypothetical protein